MSSDSVQGKASFPEQRQIKLDPIRWALQEDNQDWYRDLVEHSRDLLCIHDLQGRLLSVNPVPARLLGYSVEEMLQIPMREMIVPEYRELFDLYLKQIERDGEAHGFMIVLGRSGERRIWEYHNTLQTTGAAAPIVLGLAHDITEKRQAAAKFLELLEAAPDAMVVTDGQAQIVLVNVQVEQMFGYQRAELLGQRIEMLVPERLRERHCELRDDFLRTQRGMPTSGKREFVALHKDGHEFALEINLSPLQTAEGVLVTSAIRDITQRKRAEERLRQYEKAMEGLEEMIAVVDRDYRYVIANRAFLKYRGMENEQVIGRRVAEILNKGIFEAVVKEKLDEAFQGKIVRYEMKHNYPELGERDLSISYFPIEERSRIDRVACVLQDITERKRAEEALRTSEERFRVALKNSPIAVFSLDRDLRYTWMYNPQLVGATSSLGKTPIEFFGSEEGERIMESQRRVLETGVGMRHEVQIAKGDRKHYFDTTIEPVSDSTGAVIGLTGASTDVTELRETSEALREAKKKLTEEKLYLEQEIDTELGFGEIVGHSAALKEVMEQVGKVAASNATVLLLGETGTGKELVARALHRLSRRAGNSFIKMNCAAIPSGLLESELFGYEKGAFTGAVGKKLGRLELADKGTLFLDEIGEISLALQPKLLRVLQDQEFERLGGTQTLKVDFRLIAATNRDLAESVKKSEFRSDLYYRLNVFPVRVPPLRERREDIRLLVEHFVQKFAKRMNRKITSIPKKTMDALEGWDWPGNVRELENFVERSVILTHGSVLVSPLAS